MKLGTLVRWNHPEDIALGIVVGEKLGMIAIRWFNSKNPRMNHCGYYPRKHELMEVVSEV
tara:strand:- start:205 stop:384 length:180 start_codon:yes stop_codon:yes gene_type:complete